MEKLASVVSKHNIKANVFILWSNRHRITLVESATMGHLRVKSVDKLPLLIYSHYSLKEKEFKMEKSKERKLTMARYMVFDGHQLREWVKEDEKHTIQPFFYKWFKKVKSEYQYKDTKYFHDIIKAMHSPKYMKKWLEKPQVRYAMLYKTLFFLASSGINPTVFNNAETGFSVEVKKQVVARSKDILGVKGVRRITRNGVEIELIR
jgi:hypothetical protein